jgi:hypothetical protein
MRPVVMYDDSYHRGQKRKFSTIDTVHPQLQQRQPIVEYEPIDEIDVGDAVEHPNKRAKVLADRDFAAFFMNKVSVILPPNEIAAKLSASQGDVTLRKQEFDDLNYMDLPLILSQDPHSWLRKLDADFKSLPAMRTIFSKRFKRLSTSECWLSYSWKYDPKFYLEVDDLQEFMNKHPYIKDIKLNMTGNCCSRFSNTTLGIATHCYCPICLVERERSETTQQNPKSTTQNTGSSNAIVKVATKLTPSSNALTVPTQHMIFTPLDQVTRLFIIVDIPMAQGRCHDNGNGFNNNNNNNNNMNMNNPLLHKYKRKSLSIALPPASLLGINENETIYLERIDSHFAGLVSKIYQKRVTVREHTFILSYSWAYDPSDHFSLCDLIQFKRQHAASLGLSAIRVNFTGDTCSTQSDEVFGILGDCVCDKCLARRNSTRLKGDTSAMVGGQSWGRLLLVIERRTGNIF